MTWTIKFHPDFAKEVLDMHPSVRVELIAQSKNLEIDGPMVGRPHVDTLNGSKHSNMKELRFRANDGVWRAAFAFDPVREAVFLVAGDKSGTSEKRFYRQLIDKADRRFDDHLAKMKEN